MTKFWTVYLIRFVSIYFIFSVIIASFLYPGGNIFEPEQTGYSFAKNYLSDLGGYKSRSGEINFLSSFIFNLTIMHVYIISTLLSFSLTFFIYNLWQLPNILFI